MLLFKPILFIIISFLFLSCNKTKNKEEANDDDYAKAEQQNENTLVKVQTARRDLFNLELISNGKAEATRKVVIKFESQSIITDIKIKNGERVKKGDILAIVNDSEARQKLEEARLTLEKTKLDLRLQLISEGLKTMDDTSKLSPQRQQAILIQCGYASGENTYEKAKREYATVQTRAPFDGIVADLSAKIYNSSSAYESLCTLIDDANMEVVFNVLETEISHVHPGMEVEITPYAKHEHTLKGIITEVNPRIDENGMVKVKAETDNRQAILIDGMNVSIVVKRQIENKIIVPKSAVLPRQGKKVIFIYQGGKAIWRYVVTGEENSTEISVEEGISPGDTVIFENNLGLSHMNNVTIE